MLFLLVAAALHADIAVIVALEEQAAAVRTIIQPAGQPLREGGRTIEHGFLDGTTVHLVLSGAGLVPTAQTTTLLLSRYPIDRVISYGIAGGLGDPDPAPGTIFVATNVKAHNQGIVRDMGTTREPRPDLARTAGSDAGAALAASTAAALTRAGIDVTSGTLVCGDEFISSPEKRRELRQQFQALAVDMNGTGITMPSDSWSVPWVVVRRISDRADASAAVDFARNTRTPAKDLDVRVMKVLLRGK